MWLSLLTTPPPPKKIEYNRSFLVSLMFGSQTLTVALKQAVNILLGYTMYYTTYTTVCCFAYKEISCIARLYHHYYSTFLSSSSFFQNPQKDGASSFLLLSLDPLATVAESGGALLGRSESLLLSLKNCSLPLL